MHNIVIRGPQKKRNPREYLGSLISNRAVVIGLAIFIAGLFLLAYSRDISYTNLDHITQHQSGVISESVSANVSMSSISNYPANVTFSFLPASAQVHYELYSYNQYRNLQGITVTHAALVGTGNVTSNQSIVLPSMESSQNYYMILSEGSNTSVNYNVTVDTAILQIHYGDPTLGLPALFIVVVGAITLAAGITLSIKHD